MRVKCGIGFSVVHARVVLHISINSRVYSAIMVDSHFSEAGSKEHLKAH